VIKVETPTHLAGNLEFMNGAIGTLVMSFDVWAHTLPHIEIHGTTGSMRVPDPNGFSGSVFVRRFDAKEWVEVPHSHGYADQNRSIGLADMAFALRTGRTFRPNGKLTYHVLDIMHAFLDSAKERRYIELTSQCERPASLAMDLLPGSLGD
jgi:predicted dehydrogenase